MKSNSISRLLLPFIAVVTLMSMVQEAYATSVTFAQGELTSEADILNLGTVVVANNTGTYATPLTINGVAFGSSNANFHGSSTGSSLDFSHQFATNSSFDQLLSGMVFQHGSFGYLTLDLTGLTAGEDYLLQLFMANDYNTTGHTSRVSIQGQSYDMYDLGNTADYIRATFTASSTSELVTFGNGTTDIASRAVVNAYALENVTPSAVPLPAAAWLFGSALFGFVSLSNRRKV
jgi:hypothetical protein